MTYYKITFRMLKKILCWTFGHEPYSPYPAEYAGYDYPNHTPCARCGVLDISYHDLVSPSRYEWIKSEIKHYFYFKWKYYFSKSKQNIDGTYDDLPF